MTKQDARPERRQSIGARRNPATAEAIRAAAYDVLMEKGHGGFSIEAVARRARAGKPTIYRWWPSKTALLLDVYDAQKRDIRYPVTDDLEDDLRLFLKSLLDHWRTEPYGAIFRSVIAEAQSDPSARDAFLQYIRARRQRLAKMLDQPRANGLADRADADVAAALVISFAWMRLLTDSLDATDKEIADAARCIIRGAAPP